MRRFKSGFLLLMMLASACDHRNGTPTSPSSQVTLVSVRMSGPTSVAPGETAHYTATAEYSDGSSKDVTADAGWSPQYNAFDNPIARAEFAVLFTGPGVAVGNSRGERNIYVRYEGKTGILNVLVLEPGTFKLSGVVSDTSGGTLAGVTVEVLSGTGKGLKATTGHQGEYGLYGVAGPVHLRTSAEGFTAELRDVVVSGNDRTEPFALSPVETPADVSGTWTMTVTPSPKCRPGLPDVAQGRTYQYQLIQRGTNIEGRISSPTVKMSNPNEIFGLGTVLGSRVRLVFGGDTDEGDYTSPTLYDQLSQTETFGFSGFADGTVKGSEIRAVLNGDLVYDNTNIPRTGFFPRWYCRTTDHVVTLWR